MKNLGIKDKRGLDLIENDIVLVGQNLRCKIVWIGKNIEDQGDEIHCAYHLKVLSGENKGMFIPIDSYALNNCWKEIKLN